MFNDLRQSGNYLLALAKALLLIVVIGDSFAAEIDSVTTRNIELKNSREAINIIINQRILEGVRKANEKRVSLQVLEDLELNKEAEYCDEEKLYLELRKSVFGSGAMAWGLKGYQLDLQLRELLAMKSYSLSLNDSIYRDIDYIEGISLNLKELSDVVNINGHLVGLDKIGHFFAEGWQYFEMVGLEGKTIPDALMWGKEKESGMFGYSTTGIFSFADLVANFNGMRFWNKVLLKQDDPLKGVLANYFNRSYVTCGIQIIESIKSRKIVKAWEYNAQFDIADYIDGSWDEGNNCNSYADPMIEDKVMKRIRDADEGFACPFRKEACLDAREKYEEYSKSLLHPFCLSIQ